MRKLHWITLLCMVLVLVSAVSIASAAQVGHLGTTQEQAAKTFDWKGNYTLKNVETASFDLFAGPYEMYDQDGTRYRDVLFDTENVVTGKSSVKWIKITKYAQGIIINIDRNYTQKARSGKVTVTAKGYKATLVFKQYGVDKITSAKRSKKTITLKFSLSKGAKAHYLEAYSSKLKKGKTSGFQEIFFGNYTAKSYKVTVEKNHRYVFYIGPAVPHTRSWTSWVYNPETEAYEEVEGEETEYYYSSTSAVSFDVLKVTGTQKPTDSWTMSK